MSGDVGATCKATSFGVPTDDHVTTCWSAATEEWLDLAGQWLPVCEAHGRGRGVPEARLRPLATGTGEDVEAVVLTIARSLNRHALSRPYGEKAAWCVCLTWSINQTEDRAADERAYEVHVATHVAAALAAHDAATADRVRRETAAEVLREAHNEIAALTVWKPGSGPYPSVHDALRVLADRIAREQAR